MKLPALALLLMTIVGVLSAVVPKKAVIVTYTEDTPEYILTEAKNAITAAGGLITHEYNIIK
jgi:hypothetical protein